MTARIPKSEPIRDREVPALRGYVIPPERAEGALVRLEELLGFLDQLDALDIGTAAPASTFDPSWDRG